MAKKSVKKDKESLIRVLVMRESNDETTFAVVSAQVTRNVFDAASLRDALTEALTQWCNCANEGREAWEESDHDFNIGDLGSRYLGCESLQPYLNNAGVEELEIAIERDIFTCQWVYDTVLMDPEP